METVFKQMYLNVIFYIICLLLLSSHLHPGHQRVFLRFPTEIPCALLISPGPDTHPGNLVISLV